MEKRGEKGQFALPYKPIILILLFALFIIIAITIYKNLISSILPK